MFIDKVLTDHNVPDKDELEEKPPEWQEDSNIPEECVCTDNRTGMSYNFCYKLNTENTTFGTRFSCKWLPLVQKLKLLEARGYIKLKNSGEVCL